MRSLSLDRANGRSVISDRRKTLSLNAYVLSRQHSIGYAQDLICFSAQLTMSQTISTSRSLITSTYGNQYFVDTRYTLQEISNKGH